MNDAMHQIAFVEAADALMPDCFVRLSHAGAPTLVAIHGISRNAAELATRLARHPALAGVTIVAPLFTKGRFGQYQQLLAPVEHHVRSDEALFDLLGHLHARFGIAADKVRLFGFSGGAQMAHRLAMLYPQRVERLCSAAAGWYLMPEADLPYPFGLHEAPGGAPDLQALLALPIRVLVGNQDRRLDESLRMDPEIVLRQGSHRLARARAWVQAIRSLGEASGRKADIAMVVLQGGTHDFGQCVREAGLIDQVVLALAPEAADAGFVARLDHEEGADV